MVIEFQEFINRAADYIQERLGEDCSVSVRETLKNNGKIRRGLLIENKLSNIAPCIYLEEYYRGLEDGEETLQEVLMEIMSTYEEAVTYKTFDTYILGDYGSIRGRIRGKLINTEKNRGYLLTTPHREFLDLSMVYEILLVEERGVQGKIRIDNAYMEYLGITEQELYVDAKANMEKSLLIKMDNMLCELLEEEVYRELPKASVSMYVLCNKSRMYGAIGMTDKKAMQKAAEIFGGDFIILPSSVHDLILVPDVEEAEEAKRLAREVQEINETQVLADEVLSGHVYRYCHQTGEIEIVA